MLYMCCAVCRDMMVSAWNYWNEKELSRNVAQTKEIWHLSVTECVRDSSRCLYSNIFWVYGAFGAWYLSYEANCTWPCHMWHIQCQQRCKLWTKYRFSPQITFNMTDESFDLVQGCVCLHSFMCSAWGHPCAVHVACGCSRRLYFLRSFSSVALLGNWMKTTKPVPTGSTYIQTFYPASFH